MGTRGKKDGQTIFSELVQLGVKEAAEQLLGHAEQAEEAECGQAADQCGLPVQQGRAVPGAGVERRLRAVRPQTTLTFQRGRCKGHGRRGVRPAAQGRSRCDWPLQVLLKVQPVVEQVQVVGGRVHRHAAEQRTRAGRLLQHVLLLGVPTHGAGLSLLRAAAEHAGGPAGRLKIIIIDSDEWLNFTTPRRRSTQQKYCRKITKFLLGHRQNMNLVLIVKKAKAH